jgi:hypothetical protein
MMTTSLPFLIGSWRNEESKRDRLVMIAGIAAALLGVLMSATRVNFIVSSVMLISTLLIGKMGWKRQVGFFVVIAAIAVLAMQNSRLQRFQTLKDTDYVQDRIAGSVNRGTLEILLQYPLGNGLGGGGTSLPYFLQNQVRHPVATENEYGRISLEQGILGLLLWLGFLFWFISGYGPNFGKTNWASARKLIWVYTTFCFSVAWIGTGMLTAIPLTAVLLLGMGWVAVPMKDEPRRRIPSAAPRPEPRPVRIPTVTPA